MMDSRVHISDSVVAASIVVQSLCFLSGSWWASQVPAAGLPLTLTLNATEIRTAYSRLVSCQHCPTTLHWLWSGELFWFGRVLWQQLLRFCCLIAMKACCSTVRCSSLSLSGVRIEDIQLLLIICMEVGLLPWACCYLHDCRRRVKVLQAMQRGSPVHTPGWSHTVPNGSQYSLDEDSLENIFFIYLWPFDFL